MSNVILLPAAAVEEVCHEEQLRIWAHEVVCALGMENFLNISSYADSVDIEEIVKREIKSIIEAAFDHPAATTIRRRT